MTTYIVLVCLLLLFDAVARSRSASIASRKVLLVVALVALGLVSGMRSASVGFDTQKYLDWYDVISEFGPDAVTYWEAGFRYTIYLFGNTLNLDNQYLLLIVSVCLMVALYYYITTTVESQYWLFAVFLFVAGTFYFASMNIMRQYFAMALVLIGFAAWPRGHKVFALTMMTLGISIHFSAVVMLLVPILSVAVRLGRVRHIIVVMYILAIVVFVVGVSDVASIVLNNIDRWDQYAESHWISGRNYAAALKLILPNLLLLYILARRSFYSRDSYEKTLSMRGESANAALSDMSIAGTIMYVATLNVGFGIVTLTRISELFSVFYVVLLSRTIGSLNSGWRVVVSFGVTVYYLALMAGSVFIQDANWIVPYKMVLFD